MLIGRVDVGASGDPASRHLALFKATVASMLIILSGCLFASSAQAQRQPPPNSKELMLKVAEQLRYVDTGNSSQVCNAFGQGLLFYFFQDYRNWWWKTAAGRKANRAQQAARGKYPQCNWLASKALEEAYGDVIYVRYYAYRYSVYARARAFINLVNQAWDKVEKSVECAVAVAPMTKALAPFRAARLTKLGVSQAIKALVC